MRIDRKGNSKIYNSVHEAARLFGCYRLSARIHDLKEAGHDIKTTMKVGKKPNGNVCNYAEYTLIKEGE